MMDVLIAIERRRSVRAFTNQNVPEELVEKLIDAGTRAPSAGNLQPWEFIIIREPQTKQRLVMAALEQKFIEEAPIVIVVCANEARSSIGYGTRGKTLYCIQDTAAAIQNIHLAAHSFGLGTCWIGAFKENSVRQILQIPYGIRPVAIIPVGYPEKTPSPRHRRPISEVIHYETF